MSDQNARKIKIALVAPSMQIVGGQSIQANRLREVFEADAQIEIDFIPTDPPNIFQNIKYLRTIFTSLKFWRLLLIKVPRADLVHVFSPAMSGYLFSALPPLFFAKLFGKEIVLNYHSGELEDHLETWKKTALPTIKKFDEIVVPSQFLADVFARYDLPAKVIYNFLDTEKFVFRERKPLAPVFLSNRNFEAHYNVGCVLRAFALIQKEIPAARLIVAGFGSEEARLKKMAVELKLERTEFTGKIPSERMPEIYQRADIYLNASVVDNMPLSLIEAFACGLPVVSSNAGGIPYIIENGRTGLLVEKNDCENLAKKALELLGNQDAAQKLITNARLECRKYEIQKIKKDWEKYFITAALAKN